MIVLDLTMPNLSGREALIRIREMQPEIPVIVISGYEANQGGESAEFPNFLHKPFSMAELREQVEALWNLQPTKVESKR